jgi:hypothetical protein
MSSENPWFKFIPSDWLGGSVQLLSDAEKGTYIDLISLIWKENGEIIQDEILSRKLRLNHATACDRIKSYCDLGILVCDNNNLSIKFVSNQLDSLNELSKRNSENAQKRWEKSKSSMRPHANKNREEEIRKEEIRKEEIREGKENTLPVISVNDEHLKSSRAFIEAIQIYPKPIAQQKINFARSSWNEQVEKADGFEVLLFSIKSYAEYIKLTDFDIQFVPALDKFLDREEWRTDWASVLKQNQNKTHKHQEFLDFWILKSQPTKLVIDAGKNFLADLDVKTKDLIEAFKKSPNDDLASIIARVNRTHTQTRKNKVAPSNHIQNEPKREITLDEIVSMSSLMPEKEFKAQFPGLWDRLKEANAKT